MDVGNKYLDAGLIVTALCVAAVVVGVVSRPVEPSVLHVTATGPNITVERKTTNANGNADAASISRAADSWTADVPSTRGTAVTVTVTAGTDGKPVSCRIDPSWTDVGTVEETATGNGATATCTWRM